jgi:hypothetical protein
MEKGKKNDVVVSIVCSSNKHHVADLHNRVRTLTTKQKFVGYNSELKAYTHTIIDDINLCLEKEYNSSTVTADWDGATVVNLKSLDTQGVSTSKSGPGVSTSKSGPKLGSNASGTTASGTTGSPTTHKASIRAEMPCTDADKVLANKTGTEAFKTAFKQNSGMSGATLKKDPTLKKFGCPRRLKDGARKLSTTGIEAEFEYTTTSTQPSQLDATAFKNAVNTELTNAELPVTTGVTDITPSSTTPSSTKKTASSAMKMQVVSISLTSLLIAMAWC